MGPAEDGASAAERAGRIEQRLATLLRNVDALGPASARKTAEGWTVTVSVVPVVTVSARDAEDNLIEARALAAQWVASRALARARDRRLERGGRFVAETRDSDEAAFGRLAGPARRRALLGRCARRSLRGARRLPTRLPRARPCRRSRCSPPRSRIPALPTSSPIEPAWERWSLARSSSAPRLLPGRSPRSRPRRRARPASTSATRSGRLTARTAFIAKADLFYRRVNLEHAAASPTGLAQGALLVALLAMPLIAATEPPVTVWGVHPGSLAIPVAASDDDGAAVLEPGVTCWRIAQADRVAVIIDAADVSAR